MDLDPFLSRLLFMGLGLGLTQYWIRLNLNLGVNTVNTISDALCSNIFN